MSSPPKPDLARGWLRAEKLVEEEGDRLATMSDEDFEREMRALPDPAGAPSADELIARAAERAAKPIEGAGAGVGRSAAPAALPLRQRKTRWAMALVAAAALGGLGVAVGLHGPDVTAPPQGDKGRAAKLREEAFAACDAKQWRVCGDKLREAKAEDPAGDGVARVQAAYKAALEGLASERDPGRR